MALLEASEALSGQARLFREDFLEKFAKAIELASATVVQAAVGFFVFDDNITKVVLEHFHVLGRLAHTHEGSNEHRVIVQLHDVVRPVHVYLDILLLKFLEFFLFQVIGERALGFCEMASKNEEFVLSRLVKYAPADGWIHSH